MKKLLLIIIVILVVLAGIGYAAWHYAPHLAFRLLGRAIGGSVIARESNVTYRNGAIFLTLNGVTATGKVEGRIGHCEVEFLLAKGLYVKRLTVSDFDISVQGGESNLILYPVPVERAEITKGLLNYGGRKYQIREIVVTDFNTGKKLQFSIDGGVEGIGNIKTHGEGIFGGEKRSDISGRYSLSQVDVGRILKDYEGTTDSQGTFSYRNETLTVDGRFHAPYFSIWEKFFTRRIGQEEATANMHLTVKGEIISADLTGIRFRETPISLRFKTRKKDLLYLEMTTGFLPIPEVVKYVDIARLTHTDSGPFSYVTDGDVRVGRLVFRKDKPFAMEIDLREAVAGAGKIVFEDVKGSLRVDEKSVALSNLGGRYGESSLSSISGVISLGLHQDVDVRGEYAAALKDIEKLYKPDGISAEAGVAQGHFELKGRQDVGFRVAGTGALRDGRLVARTIPLGVSGEYSFDRDSLEFTRLHVKGSGTDLQVAGRVAQESIEVKGGGVVNGRDLVVASLVPREYAMDGPIGVEGAVSSEKEKLSVRGKASMTGLTFEVPGFVRKPSGVDGAAVVSVMADRRSQELHVDELGLTLGSIRVEATGRADRHRVAEARILLDAPGIERASGLFFFHTLGAQGDLKVDIGFEDLRFPVSRLPAIRGSLSFRNGTIHPPFLVEPIRSVNLDCGFSGDSFVLAGAGLRVGSTVMEKGRLNLTGLERPSFDLALEMSHFNPDDFRRPVREAFSLPVIEEDSLIARTSGNFRFTGKTVQIQRITGRDAVLEGRFGGRTLSLTEGRMKTETGSISLGGSALLASVPDVRLTAELKDIDAAKMLELAGGRAGIIEGGFSVDADLRFSGRDADDLVKSASGRVAITSSQGVIRKWNLISKLLAVTNVFDLILGRVDLTQRGLSYRRMSTTLEAQDGVFRTSNFLIDSPSMVITGRGEVDLAQGRIDGRMLVSPLVMIDRIIEWIPLVRNIFRERKTGILFFIYDVEGPIHDPEIRSSYVESMGRRIFNIFMNIIRLPKEVLDLLPKEEPAKSQ